MKISIKKAFAVLAAAVTMCAAMGSVTASAGNPSNWSVLQVNGAGLVKYTYNSTVTGLSPGTDMGIRFRKSSYSDPSSMGVRARCDIANHNYKRYPSQYAYITATQSTSTCLFIDNWEDVVAGASVAYTITAQNYTGSDFEIRGLAD